MCKRLQDAFTRVGETNLLPLAFVGERAMMIPPFRLSWKEIQSFSRATKKRTSPANPNNIPGSRRFFYG